MKKVTTVFCISILFFLFMGESSFAQSPIEIGGKIGLNFASLSGNDVPQGNSSRTGFLIGGFMSYKFAPFFGLEPEIFYSAKGATGSVGTGESYTIALNYFEVPVLLKFYVPLAPGTPVNLNVFAGPDFNFNVSSSLDETVSGQTNNTDISNDVSGFDFDVVFGAGVGFKVGITDLIFDLRYSLGLGSAATNNLDLKNRAFTLTGGVGFTL
jgi:Outer membrane protein beta-barrel domain